MNNHINKNTQKVELLFIAVVAASYFSSQGLIASELSNITSWGVFFTTQLIYLCVFFGIYYFLPLERLRCLGTACAVFGAGLLLTIVLEFLAEFYLVLDNGSISLFVEVKPLMSLLLILLISYLLMSYKKEQASLNEGISLAVIFFLGIGLILFKQSAYLYELTFVCLLMGIVIRYRELIYASLILFTFNFLVTPIRVINFLSPDQALTHENLMAMSGGGFWGVGFGQGMLRRLADEQSIANRLLCVLAEEGGLVLVLLLLLSFIVFIVITVELVNIAINHSLQYEALLITGLSVWIVLEAFNHLLNCLVFMSSVPSVFLLFSLKPIPLFVNIICLGLILRAMKSIGHKACSIETAFMSGRLRVIQVMGMLLVMIFAGHFIYFGVLSDELESDYESWRITQGDSGSKNGVEYNYVKK